MLHVKAGGKAVLVLAVVGWAANHFGYLDPKVNIASSVPKIDVPTAASNLASPEVQAPSQINVAPVASSGYTPVVEVMAWNAQMGLVYANGGKDTKPGSLMAKNGVSLRINRQDDTNKMATDLVDFSREIKNGVRNPTKGAAFVIVMGDGVPAMLTGAMSAIDKEAPGQALKVIASFGYSRGEDKLMMLPEVKVDAQKARGALIATVLRDGDAHVAFKWADDNQIPINPDEKTYDPNALNFVNSSDYVDSGAKFITGYCEDRPVVHEGKLSDKKQHVCVTGMASWTPVDVDVAEKKGGLVVIASTKEYMWQMPATIIANAQWANANRQLVDNILAAAFQGGEEVRSNNDALNKGGVASADVYGEKNGAYWVKYYKGTQEQDKTGAIVSLGGSITSGLGDNARLFGLKGNDNLYKSVYTVFGQTDSGYYPDILPKVLPYEKAVDTSFIEDLLKTSSSVSKAEAPVFNDAPKNEVFAQKTVHIEFETGKATFTPAARRVVDNVLNQLAVSGLSVQLNGHTDNTGNSTANLTLSKARAEAVKAYLVANAGTSFPANRVVTRGYGDTSPAASNATAEGRAQNRRVEVLMVQ